MPQDLKLAKSESVDFAAQTGSPATSLKKKSGRGCFLGGCLILIALIVLPIIGGIGWIASMDEATWGAKVVVILKHPEFATGFKNAISESDKLSPEQKTTLVSLYDKFLMDYDKLPPQKQEAINKNISRLIKKIFTDPKSFNQEQPQELKEIIQAIGMDTSLINVPTTVPMTPTPTTPPTTTTPTSDPSSFDIEPTSTPTTPPAPTPQPTPPTQPSEYDF